MPTKPAASDPRDREIRRLRNALYFARMTIIEQVPEELREPLSAATRCKTIEDVRAWQAWAIDRLLTMADSRPTSEMGGDPGTFRACCPLCGGEALSPDRRGFKMPTGLRRHLEGSHGNRRCPVFAAAIDPCVEEIRELAQPDYRGPRLNSVPLGPAPWTLAPEKVSEPQRPSATVIKLRPE